MTCVSHGRDILDPAPRSKRGSKPWSRSLGRVGDWVEVAIARDIIHAYLLKGLLEEEGLTVRVGNEHLQGALGDLPLDLATRPKILVRSSWAERAREVLAGEAD